MDSMRARWASSVAFGLGALVGVVSPIDLFWFLPWWAPLIAVLALPDFGRRFSRPLALRVGGAAFAIAAVLLFFVRRGPLETAIGALGWAAVLVVARRRSRGSESGAPPSWLRGLAAGIAVAQLAHLLLELLARHPIKGIA